MFVCLFLTIWIWWVTSHTWRYEHIKTQSLLTCVTWLLHGWSSWLMCNMCGDSRASTSRHRAFGHVWHDFYVCVWCDPSDPCMCIMSRVRDSCVWLMRSWLMCNMCQDSRASTSKHGAFWHVWHDFYVCVWCDPSDPCMCIMSRVRDSCVTHAFVTHVQHV